MFTIINNKVIFNEPAPDGSKWHDYTLKDFYWGFHKVDNPFGLSPCSKLNIYPLCKFPSCDCAVSGVYEKERAPIV